MVAMLRRFLILFLIVTVTGPSFAAVEPLEKRVVERTLANGMKLLVLERHFSPTVSIRMMFRTGSVDEVSGKTGLAHMFEHMMFKGTKTLGTKNYAKEAPLLRQIDELHRRLDDERAKGDAADQNRMSEVLDKLRAVEEQAAALLTENELWNLYEREGASGLNAGTSHDFTQYVVDLPTNKLELWAILDSDRLKNAVFRQFYQEREVVKEERRMRVDTNPEGKLIEQFFAMAYQAHPYQNPTIGWDADLDHLSIADLEDFYRRYYTPDRLTIAIVGDVNASKVIQMVEHYFGDWRAPGLPQSHKTDEPPQAGTRRLEVRVEAQPHLLMGFHIPAHPDPDKLVCLAITNLLANGTSSRLYKTLVEKRRLASSVETGEDFPGERYPTMFLISLVPRHPHTTQELEKAVWEELNRLKKEPVQDWELEKFRSAVDVGLLNTLQTNGGMAETLVYDQAVLGGWRYLIEFQERIKKITAQDIQRVAQKFFVPDNLTVGTTVSRKTR
jgi:predicted Zn-dependent peptidase